MSRIAAISPGKWVSRISEILISIASLLIFLLLDFLNVIIRLVDKSFQGKIPSCYCLPRDQTQQQDSFTVGNGGQNVIFIHGFLSSSSLWEETMFQNLSEHSRRKYRLFAVDIVGFGKSPEPRNCLNTLRDHPDMIEKSVIIPFQLKSFHIVAHSMGCVIALALAAKYSASLKSLTLVAPYYISSSRGDATAEVLRRLAVRQVWPPLQFVSAFMSWYEHLGRCMCFFICRNHRAWEWLMKLLTRTRDLHFMVTDLPRHTHHPAWHTMHNVVCGGAKFLEGYLEASRAVRAKIYVVQGRKDQVVPEECSLTVKIKDPEIELDVVPNVDRISAI